MAGFGFRPAPQVDPDELERRDATSPGPGGTGRNPTQPSNVGLLRLTKITPDDERETTDGSAESPQSVDADGFRMSWEQRLAPAAARGRWRLTPKGLALVGVVVAVGLVLVLRARLVPGCSSITIRPTIQARSRWRVERPGRTVRQGRRAVSAGLCRSKHTSALASLPAGGSGVRKIQATDGVPNPAAVAQKVGDVIGAQASSAQQSIDATPTGFTGWAVQLAASNSEDEAKNDLKRLSDRYASALNGSTIRLHKARVDGETVYRLRAVGLSKADATALCERLKGDGGSCFIVR